MDTSKENIVNSSANEQKASIASITQAKEQLSEEIKSIEKNISAIDEAKQKSIDVIESRKKSLLEQIDINDVPEEHRKALEQLAEAEKDIEARKESITLLDQTIAQLDIQLAEIKAQYDQAIAELEAKKQNLQQKLEYYSELDARVARLAELLENENTNYEKKLSSLLEERENLLKRTDLSETTLKAKLKELDRQIAACKKDHDVSVKSLNKLLSDVLTEAVTDKEEVVEVTELEGEVTDQEETKRSILIHEELEDIQYPSEIEYSPAEEHSPTSSKFDEELKDYFRSSYVTSATRETSEFEAEETDRRYSRPIRRSTIKDFLPYRDQISPITTSTSLGSSKIDLTSQDVEYLKVTFGKCLTLGLAEITAVQPKDPIHYLAHWLMKYRYNDEYRCVRDAEIMALMVERERLEAIQREKDAKEQAEETMKYLLEQVDILALEQQLARLALLAEEMEEGG